jgi:Ca2+-binding EF-hand superfamily protein
MAPLPAPQQQMQQGYFGQDPNGVEVDGDESDPGSPRAAEVNTQLANFHLRNSLDTWAELKRIEMENVQTNGPDTAYTDVNPAAEAALQKHATAVHAPSVAAAKAPAPSAENPMKMKALAMFQIFDADNNGEMSMDEMASLIKGIATTTPGALADVGGVDAFTPATIAEMMQLTLDTEGDPQLTRFEFVSKCCQGHGMLADLVGRCDMREVEKQLNQQSDQMKDKALIIFHMFDEDGSGSMDLAEVADMLESMADTHNAIDLDGMGPEMLAEMLMMEVDEDASGAISIDEFIHQASIPGMLYEMVEKTHMHALDVKPFNEISDKAMAIFTMFDTDNSGGMSASEAETMVVAIAEASMDQEKAQMDQSKFSSSILNQLAETNTNRNGDINQADFVAACGKRGLLADLVHDADLSALVADPLIRKAVVIFKLFDADNSKTLDIEELAEMIKVLADADPEGVTAGEMAGMDPKVLAGIASLEFDDDGDGVVDKAEFIDGITKTGGLVADLVASADLALIKAKVDTQAFRDRPKTPSKAAAPKRGPSAAAPPAATSKAASTTAMAEVTDGFGSDSDFSLGSDSDSD